MVKFKMILQKHLSHFEDKSDVIIMLGSINAHWRENLVITRRTNV